MVQNILRSGHSYEDSVETSLLKAIAVLFPNRRLILSSLKESARLSSEENRYARALSTASTLIVLKALFYIVSDTKWTVSEPYDA